MANTHPPVTLPGTEVRLLHSSKVDEEYKLFISLPPGYDESEDSYPVLYVTDANWLFSSFSLLSWLPIPPMIVVGIGYPTDSVADIFRLRARDFLPTQNEADENVVKEQYQMPIESGGGTNFLAFVRDELFEFIEAQYRTKPDDRTLFGYSFGGTFGIYTLFEQPDSFNRYIIGAPDLRWDNEVCFKYEQEYAAKHPDLPVKLYLSVGTLDEDLTEKNASSLFRFQAILKSRNYPGLDLKFEVFEDETHGSAAGRTASRGLRAVFK
jgi:predicted alpha/beta superfamily hydrolase